MSAPRPVWFARAETEALLDLKALRERLRAAFIDLAAGGASDPQPLRIDAPDLAANYVGFPSYWPAAGLASVKVLSGAERNPDLGLPVIDAVVVVMDAATGRIRAIMDGASITAARTAATTALAIEALGPPPAAALGLIGTGVQMIAHARAIALGGGVASILVASANDSADRAATAAREVANATGLPAQSVSRRVIAASADIIVLSSISPEPLIRRGETRPAAIIASVGPFKPDATELDAGLVAGAAAVVSDRRERLRQQWQGHEARLGSMYDGMEDLPELLAAPRAMPDGLRVFLSDGRSIEDLVAASIVLEEATRRGVAGLVLP